MNDDDGLLLNLQAVPDLPLSVPERLQVLRRIADRGQKHALGQKDSSGVDCWQHLMNELQVLSKELGVTTSLNGEGSY